MPIPTRRGRRRPRPASRQFAFLLAVTALFSLGMPGVVVTEWLAVVFGVLLFIAPWVLTYTDRVGASWERSWRCSRHHRDVAR
jgi:SPW repeat